MSKTNRSRRNKRPSPFFLASDSRRRVQGGVTTAREKWRANFPALSLPYAVSSPFLNPLFLYTVYAAFSVPFRLCPLFFSCPSRWSRKGGQGQRRVGTGRRRGRPREGSTTMTTTTTTTTMTTATTTTATTMDGIVGVA